MRLTWICTGALFVALGCRPEPNSNVGVTPVTSSFLTPSDAGMHYARIFKDSDAFGAETLMSNADANVALRAEWRLVAYDARMNPGEQPGLGRTSVERFLSAVQKQVPVSIPAWWCAAAVNGTPVGATQALHFEENDGKWLFRTSNLHLKRIPDGVRVSASGIAFLVNNRPMFCPFIGHRDSLRLGATSTFVIAMQADAAFVATYEDTPSEYQLVRIDVASGSRCWSASVWAAGGFTNYMGRGWHRAEVVSGRESVYVLGAASDCLYIEGFDRDSGKNILRFSTAY